MTEDEYSEALQLLVALVDSYVARHRPGVPGGHTDGTAASGMREPHGPTERPRASGELLPLRERHDLLAQAVKLWLTGPDPRSRFEEQLAHVDAEIRRQEQTADRYLLAFEAGSLSDADCGERVRALKEAIISLRAHREELVTQLDGSVGFGDVECLEGVSFSDFMREHMEEKIDLPVVKALLRVLIDEVRVDGNEAIYPTFRLPPQSLKE